MTVDVKICIIIIGFCTILFGITEFDRTYQIQKNVIVNAKLSQELELANTSVEQLTRKLEKETYHRKYTEFIHNLYNKEHVWVSIDTNITTLDNLPVLRPVTGIISSEFGQRNHPILQRKMFHNGLDIATNKGTFFVAPGDGYVTISKISGGYGLLIVIDHGGKLKTLFAHADTSFVTKGQYVKQGEPIGTVGSTGLATGDHLHYEIRYNNIPIDPNAFMLLE